VRVLAERCGPSGEYERTIQLVPRLESLIFLTESILSLAD